MSEDSVKDKKKQLRDTYTELRKSLNPEITLEKSRKIQKKLIDLDSFMNAEIIHTYISMNDRNEVNTHELIETALQQGKSVVVPRIEDDNRLSHHKIQGLDDLETNDWGVPEPPGEADTKPAEPDLILVPMVSGDKIRNRLGYGKGYYDRFLKETVGIKVGLLFDIQVYDQVLPTDKYDVQLDLLITESRIL
ncbi:MAG: 5-formyltetrahydrofolate cyclo-ligase [Balneolaceae bacterium]|nr:5-formyltetrahydrofolate cyclo-ligase [Balneolaceae bacterium]